jgi:hypothetical protein
MTAATATQYLLTVSGGSGSSYSVPPPISGDTGWYDSGTTLRVSTNGTYDTSGGIRQRVAAWSIDSEPSNAMGTVAVVTTSAIVMDGPHSVYFTSVPQYLVTIVVKDSEGANVLTPESVLLDVNGGTQAATSGSVWVDGTSTVIVTTVMWHGLNVAPTQTAQYGISSPLTITIDTRVYDATIVVDDPLGLAVGGADASISLANGTTVHTSSGGDGTIVLRQIPLGTYQATISSLGFSTALSGDASTSGTSVAHLPLSWALILVIVVAIALVAVGIMFVRRRGIGRATNYSWKMPAGTGNPPSSGFL